MLKLSFSGDIMSSKEQDEAVFRSGSYRDVFSHVGNLFQDSSYVVANLETTISGSNLGYTDGPASFNTPDLILKALKDVGVSMVTNANNHILDRGTTGMFRTIEILDKYGIEHTGCYRTKTESDTIFVKSLKGIRLAFLSFTYGTNSEFNGNMLPAGQSYLIDLLKEQSKLGEGGFQTKHHRSIIVEKYLRGKLLQLYRKLEDLYYRLNPHLGGDCIDTVDEKEITNPNNFPYLKRLKDKVEKARKISDLVVLCLHCGGQYNVELGEYTTHIFRYIKGLDVDIVVGNHPHCILGSGFRKHRLYCYSLGNFSFTPGGMWYIDTVLAEYSVVLHVNIDENTKIIKSYTYSIVKNIIGHDGISRVFDTYDLYFEETNDLKKKQLLAEIQSAAKLFSGSSPRIISKEYVLRKF